jgi:acyl carrier protein
MYRLQEIFVEVFDDKNLVLTPQTNAHDIAEWDSLRHITIIVAAEQRFGMKFRSADVDSLTNVGEMVKQIRHRMETAVHA